MKRLLFAGLIIVVLAALAWAAWYFLSPKSRSDELILYGNVDLREVSLAFNNSERIAAVLVHKGEVLARLDTSRLEPQVAARAASPGIRTDGFERKDFAIDFQERKLRIGANVHRLSGREIELLRVLIGARGRTVSHKEILSEIWGAKTDADTQYVRVLVMQLRQKICIDPARPQFLISEPGLGYRLVLPYNDR